ALVPFRMFGPASVKVQADGHIVVGAAGWVKDNSGNNIGEFLVTRFASSGSLDTSFGVNNGATIVPYASLPQGSQCNGMAFEPDGRIVMVGLPTISGAWPFEVARFLATGPQIGSFSASPTSVTVGSTVILTANVTALNPGSTVTQVAFYVESN